MITHDTWVASATPDERVPDFSQAAQNGWAEAMEAIWPRDRYDTPLLREPERPLPEDDLARVSAAAAAGDPFLVLSAAGVIDARQLDVAHEIRDRAGGQLLSILTGAAGVDPVQAARALGQAMGLAYLPLDRIETEPELADLLDETLALSHLFAPLQREGEATWVAVADPFDSAALAAVRTQFPGAVRLVVATESDIYELSARTNAEAKALAAAAGLAQARPEDSASVVMTRGQQITGLVVLIAGAFALGYAPIDALITINALAALFYETSALFRLRLVSLAAQKGTVSRTDYLELEELDERELPIYTILVPMYKEAAVVPRVAAALGDLDYPTHKLDVLMICEEDDDETIQAVRALRLGSHFRLIVVPDSQPKTKPKACNYALAHARGEMVVIFDAEDAPEIDQCKRVLLALRDAPDNVACVQAKLDYSNAEQNLLTRWFAAEYTMWFDLILPGLARFDAPIPLGGTSNHFRIEVLRELGGWDPFNVTEDADLGVRLYKRGYKTLIVDSTTFEEANSQVGNWIRQRSRWVKGHMQTWLVHSRHPLRLRRELGWRGWMAFQLTIGGSFFAALLNPIYWGLVVMWFATSANVIRSVFPSLVYYAAGANLLLWNFGFVYAAATGVARRGHFELVRSALYSPLYWVLISIAAWKGALQLITKPFYWEKTIHGLDQPQEEPRAAPRSTTATELASA